MIGSPNPSVPDVGTTVAHSDRGMIQAEPMTMAPVRPAASDERYSYPTYFWGSVIAGTLFALSMFALSYFLMIGCHVGVAAAGTLSLGWGAAWWMVITSCIAFYFGGMLSNCISRPAAANGWIKGAAIWGLSIPLVMIIASNGWLWAEAGMPQGSVPFFGFAWTAFTLLICGLIFAMLGSSSTAFMTTDRFNRHA